MAHRDLRSAAVETRTVPDRHGVAVFRRAWPVADPAAVVVIAHGASEHSGRYDRFARALNDAGFAAYAVDHRGHGETAASTGTGRMGPPGGDAVIDDLDELVDQAVAEHPGVPVIAFGHSMGSMITLAYATRHADRLAGVVLMGFAAPVHGLAGMRELFQPAIDAGMADEPIDTLAGMNEVFEPARTPFDWLSRDDAEVDAYLADPMCGDDAPLTYGFVIELFEVVAAALEPAALARIGCPVLLVTGEQDPAAAMGQNARDLEAALTAAGVEVTSRLYPDARHELLNEINRDEVTADITGWIAAAVR